MLHASIADDLASPRERLRVLPQRGACRRRTGRRLLAARSTDRTRSPALRKAPVHPRSTTGSRSDNQRLVWLAEEAVCAVPDVAATWPTPAIAAPFYGCEPGEIPVTFPMAKRPT